MTGVLMVLSDAVGGSDDEFNRWYSDVHLPEILGLPSFVGARRFKLDARIPASSVHRYLAVYEVTDTALASAELAEARSWLTISPALATSTVVQGYYESL
jgi:hypothetical protein